MAYTAKAHSILIPFPAARAIFTEARSPIRQTDSCKRNFEFVSVFQAATLAAGYVVSRQLDERPFDRIAVWKVDVVSREVDVHYHY